MLISLISNVVVFWKEKTVNIGGANETIDITIQNYLDQAPKTQEEEDVSA